MQLIWNSFHGENVYKRDPAFYAKFDRIVDNVHRYFLYEGVRFATITTGKHLFSTPLSKLRIEKA